MYFVDASDMGFVDRGVDMCPECGTLFVTYDRPLYRKMGTFLLDLIKKWNVVRDRGGDWVYSRDVRRREGGDYAKLRHWGLVEMQGQENVVDTRRTSNGLFRPTVDGILFAGGSTRVPRSLLVRRNIVIGANTGRVSITDVLAKNFDKDQVLNTPQRDDDDDDDADNP